MRRTLGVVFCTLPLAATFVAGAPQLRTVTEGVYSAAQAERGQEVYRSQCNECHGNALQGGSGPPLTGERFSSNWSGRPLLEIRTELMEIGRIAKQAAIARKLDAFEEISEKLSDACQNCHRVYRRDAPGAMRCQ